MASFISFHIEYNQSEARNPLHILRDATGSISRKNPVDACDLHISRRKKRRVDSARQNFSVYQNFQMQVCKQYYKNRVNIHSNLLEVIDS